MMADQTPMDDPTLAALVAAAEAATPGPWVAPGPYAWGGAVEAAGEIIVYDEGSPCEADAAYIAAANPAAILAFHARLRATEAERDAYRRAEVDLLPEAEASAHWQTRALRAEAERDRLRAALDAISNRMAESPVSDAAWMRRTARAALADGGQP